MEVLSSRTLLRPVDPERSHRFYGETLGLEVSEENGMLTLTFPCSMEPIYVR